MKKLCCDKLMNVMTLENKVSCPDRENKVATSDADSVN